MDSQSNKRHWQSLAEEHGTSVRATTLSETAKALEIEALYRRLKDMPPKMCVLEVGCGNGINCVELAKRLPEALFVGVDYVLKMAQSAQANADAAGLDGEHCLFLHMDIFELSDTPATFNVVFTDRCLINLPSFEKQKEAIAILASKVRPGGTLLMIENLVEGRERQNRFRELLGLKARPRMPPFNRFFTAAEMDEAILDAGFQEYDVEYFSSLHDLMLYVLLPAMN